MGLREEAIRFKERKRQEITDAFQKKVKEIAGELYKIYNIDEDIQKKNRCARVIKHILLAIREYGSKPQLRSYFYKNIDEIKKEIPKEERTEDLNINNIKKMIDDEKDFEKLLENRMLFLKKGLGINKKELKKDYKALKVLFKDKKKNKELEDDINNLKNGFKKQSELINDLINSFKKIPKSALEIRHQKLFDKYTIPIFNRLNKLIIQENIIAKKLSKNVYLKIKLLDILKKDLLS